MTTEFSQEVGEEEDQATLRLSWKGVEQLIATHVHAHSEHLKYYTQYIAVSRGGLPIACLLSQLMDVRRISSMSVMSYLGRDKAQLTQTLYAPDPKIWNLPTTLIIDDIADTGDTLRCVKAMFPLAHAYALVVKPRGAPLVQGYSMSVSQECWVEFPWELIREAYLPVHQHDWEDRPQ